MNDLTSLLLTSQAKKINFSPDFLEALVSYGWPGNVRDLVNTIESAVTTAGAEPILYATHLPSRIRIHFSQTTLPGGGMSMPASEDPLSPQSPLPELGEFLGDLRVEAEKRYLETLVVESRGEIQEACKIAGLGRSRLYGLLKKHDMQLDQ